ncbi:uncharacterized protein PHA67_017953 isoform 1-T2 [Liasis olivaceus]
MEASYIRSNQLPDMWKTEFAKMYPLIPAIFLVVVAIAIIVVGCFGQAGIGTPWWSGSMILISGACFLKLVLMQQTFPWERCAYIANIISMVISLLAILVYSLEFSLATLPESPFSYRISVRTD